jgi:hypothetical protein
MHTSISLPATYVVWKHVLYLCQLFVVDGKEFGMGFVFIA